MKDDYLKRVIAIDCNDPFKFIEMIDDENEIDDVRDEELENKIVNVNIRKAEIEYVIG